MLKKLTEAIGARLSSILITGLMALFLLFVLGMLSGFLLIVGVVIATLLLVGSLFVTTEIDLELAVNDKTRSLKIRPLPVKDDVALHD